MLRWEWRASLDDISARANIRASDDDREKIADRLRAATAEGRLHAYELEERLARALRARTYGELDAVVADLPSGRQLSRRQPGTMARWAVPAVGLMVAIPIVVMAVAAVVAAALFVLTGAFAMLALWVFIGWAVVGHRHRGPLGYPGRRRPAWHR